MLHAHAYETVGGIGVVKMVILFTELCYARALTRTALFRLYCRTTLVSRVYTFSCGVVLFFVRFRMYFVYFFCRMNVC